MKLHITLANCMPALRDIASALSRAESRLVSCRVKGDKIVATFESSAPAMETIAGTLSGYPDVSRVLVDTFPPRVPPDYKQCQAEISRAFGGPYSASRCTGEPIVVARFPDPPHRKLSLCAFCQPVCARAVHGVTFKPIRHRKQPTRPRRR
jgi:hypothetical protein